MEMLASRLVSEETPEVQELPPEVQKLIQQHKRMFQDLPMMMPPKRETKKIIKVKLGSYPINIKLYRYPHPQKT